ncbi:MAG: 50S ribosomal protein L29 [Patescibacteria group bacterium]|nr:50S ribosomal protein L29 [Patescibacteria group bacterium]
MKIKELREKSDVELERMLAEFRSKLQDQRFAVAGRRLKRVREMREIKKGIAQILTLQKERDSEKARPPSAEASEGRQHDSVTVQAAE